MKTRFEGVIKEMSDWGWVEETVFKKENDKKVRDQDIRKSYP